MPEPHTTPRGDIALAAAFAVAAVAERLVRPDLEATPALIALAALAGATVVTRRRAPLLGVAVLGALALLSDPLQSQLAATSVIAYSTGAYAEPRAGRFAIAALVVLYQLGVGLEEFPNLEILIPTAGPWLVGREVRKRRDLVRALAAQTRELENSGQAFTELSVQRERTRIARELHDIVTHHLAVIILLASAGRLEGEDSDHAPERLTAIAGASTEALSELEHLIEVIGSEPAVTHDPTRLQRLCDRASASGLNIELVQLPIDTRIPAGIEDLLHRIVQEALTNVLKHAPDANVQVRLAARDDHLSVEVTNDETANGGPLASTGSGLGLDGLRDRVDALAGDLTVGPRPAGGWRLRARVPLT
jgi:signal transduction histidine kinase